MCGKPHVRPIMTPKLIVNKYRERKFKKTLNTMSSKFQSSFQLSLKVLVRYWSQGHIWPYAEFAMHLELHSQVTWLYNELKILKFFSISPPVLVRYQSRSHIWPYAEFATHLELHSQVTWLYNEFKISLL